MNIMTTDSFRHGKRPVTIKLEQYDGQDFHPYFCPDCARIMFKYQGQVVAEIPGGPEIKKSDIWIEVKCDNRECGRIVYIEGFSPRLPQYKDGYK